MRTASQRDAAAPTPQSKVLHLSNTNFTSNNNRNIQYLQLSMRSMSPSSSPQNSVSEGDESQSVFVSGSFSNSMASNVNKSVYLPCNTIVTSFNVDFVL